MRGEVIRRVKRWVLNCLADCQQNLLTFGLPFIHHNDGFLTILLTQSAGLIMKIIKKLIIHKKKRRLQL